MAPPPQRSTPPPWGIAIGAAWALTLTLLAPRDGAPAAAAVAAFYLFLYVALWSVICTLWSAVGRVVWQRAWPGYPMVMVAGGAAMTLVGDTWLPLGVGATAAVALGVASREDKAPRRLPAAALAGMLALATLTVPTVIEWWSWTEPVSLVSSPSGVGQVHVVGVDGLDPTLLMTLVGRGELPGFARLQEAASVAHVAPLSGNSPELWTSYVTGRSPDEHGIIGFTNRYLRGTALRLPTSDLDFVTPRLGLLEQRALTATHRRSPALWELLDGAGATVSVHNWWATWPAEPINGSMVTRRAFLTWGEEDESRGATYPGSLHAVVKARMHDVLPDPEAATRVERFAATDIAAWSMYRDACLGGEADLCIVYQRSIDVASHAYSRTTFSDGAAPEDDRLFEELVVDAYREFDTRLAEVLDALGGDDVLVVVSDHGWRYDGSEHDHRSGDGPTGWPPGVMFVAGVHPQTTPETQVIRTIDVFPTLAVLVGLPLADDLPGRPAALADGLPRAPSVPTYGRRAVGARRAVATVGTEADDLRALGYIQ